MTNVSDESSSNLQNTHLHSIFFPENRDVYEIMWKNMVETDRPYVTIQFGACALNAQ